MNLPSPGSDHAAAEEYLFSLKPRGNKFGIDRMKLLVAELGHPERDVPAVHVAGTNGKGSVAAMLDAILSAAGWRSGLYTSPHLVKVGERVQVERQILSDTELMGYLRELQPSAARIAQVSPDDQPSFFELMTAMAFLQFKRKRCEIAVFEVGLGGRLDATNVLLPEVSVITSIAKDHCELLGEELAQIAAAKGGIIKPQRPVVIGRMPAEAERVIRDIAAANAAPVISVREEFRDDIENYPKTNLAGDYQRWNAATATLVARTLGPPWRMTEETIARGLLRVDWPGRWQRVQVADRTVVLDASHNPEGAEVLEANLSRLFAETGRRPVIVTGVLGLNRARPLIETISRHAKEIHFVVPNQPRACTHAELAALVPVDFPGKVSPATVAELFPKSGSCTAGSAGDVIVVTGSIYLLGEVMSQLARFTPPREVKRET